MNLFKSLFPWHFTWKRTKRIIQEWYDFKLRFLNVVVTNLSEVFSSNEERNPRQTTRFMFLWQIDIEEPIEQSSIPDVNLRGTFNYP